MALINKQTGIVGTASENQLTSIATVLAEGEIALQQNRKEISIGTKNGNIILEGTANAKTSMSKAASEALARDNRDKFAGSGFVEWGYGRSGSGNEPVNDGITTNISLVNQFWMGYLSSGNIANSKTVYPQVNINGNILKVARVNRADEISTIELPPAPTVTHADASNSGLLLNGKFDTDLTSWNIGVGRTIVYEAGKAKLIQDSDTLTSIGQEIDTTIGKTYTAHAWIDGGNTTSGVVFKVNDVPATQTLEQIIQSTGVAGYVSFTFEAVGTTSNVLAYCLDTGTTGSVAYIDNIFVTESSSISRTDLTFLESWHEDTSEKGVLYDLGNVQYKGTISTGSAGTFVGEETYSLFGNWQADSALVGNSIDIATLTTAQLEDFIGNPENNCYYDGDKLIQVRYRVRTIAGLGDTWLNTDTQSLGSLFGVGFTNDLLVAVKGSSVSIAGDTTDASAETEGIFQAIDGTLHNSDIVDNGAFIGAEYNGGWGVNVKSYDGKSVLALPIATIHRRNQGAYDPTINPNGTSFPLKSSGSLGAENWYASTSKKLDSISKCFDFGLNSENTVGEVSPFVSSEYGAIADTLSQRPDGLFYDQIAEGDITDLRSSAHNKSDLEVMNDTFNRAISGDERGSEGEWETHKIEGNGTHFIWKYDTTTTAWYTGSFDATSVYSIGDYAVGSFINGTDHYYVRGYVSEIASSYIKITGDNLDSGLIVGGQGVAGTALLSYPTRTKSNTMTHCDIIGDQANYPQSWKDNGVIGTPLLVGENGEDYIPDGIRTTWKLSKKYSTLLLRLTSSDNGATWASATTTIADAATNSFTKGTALPVGDMEMWFYTTHTSMAEPTVNSVVSSGAIGDVVGWNDGYSTIDVAQLTQSLIGKVPQYGGGTVGAPVSKNIEDISTLDSSVMIVSSTVRPSHNAFTLGYAVGEEVAIKVFPYSTIENGRKVINLVFKEMKYSVLDSVGATVNSWGDDAKFNIVDNVSTTIEDNGFPVLIGQKKIVTPYFEKVK